MEGGGGCSLQTTDQPGMNPMRRDNQSELLFFLGGGACCCYCCCLL